MDKNATGLAEAAIKQARDATNRLIDAHDAEGLGEFMTHDVRLIGGIAELFVGRDAAMEAYRSSFADQDFVTYRRTAWRVQIAESGDIASEWGNWEGIWRGDRPRRLAGDYHAMWRCVEKRWLLQAELYVCLEPGIAVAP